MDLSASQYNSASESGWTHYLDQSSLSENYLESTSRILEYEGKGARMKEEKEEEQEEEEGEEEDLSMVSDASSGPPHYHDEVDKCYGENWYPRYSSTSQSKNRVKECSRNQQPPHLDDTASSPVYSFTKKKVSFSGNGAVGNALDFSQGFSAARSKLKHKFQKHLKQAPEEAGGFEKKGRK